MIRSVLPLGAAALTLALAASASAQDAGGARQCFSSTQVTSTVPVGDRQVNIQVNNRDVFRVDLANPCYGLRNPQRIIVFRPVAQGVSLCSPADFVLAVNVDGSREECAVSKVTKLTREQVAALPNRERP
jgi:hypothetical protein